MIVQPAGALAGRTRVSPATPLKLPARSADVGRVAVCGAANWRILFLFAHKEEKLIFDDRVPRFHPKVVNIEASLAEGSN